VKKVQIASIILYIISFITVIFGIVYIFTPKLMPYHERFIGLSFEQLDPKVGKLFLYILKGAGSCMLAIGISTALIVKYYLKDKPARWIILIMFSLTLFPLQFITLSIGLYTPWWLVTILIVMFITAMILLRVESLKFSV
jgi:hypothetical protein